MKKLYIVLIGFLVFSGVKAQIINFPDSNFKAKLLAAGTSNDIASNQNPVYDTSSGTWSVNTYNQIDTNNDGEIEISEAISIKYLDVSSTQISDLTGIEFFTNLQYLNCNDNSLQNLNFSGMNSLQGLACEFNQLSNIDLSGFTNLQT